MRMSNYVYRCAGGETFDSVAMSVYGDERRAPELLCANPELAGRTIFAGGERLHLPLMIEGESGDTWTETAPWKV